ncbi:hypothetical protein D3C86_1849160 [compost metagenome]
MIAIQKKSDSGIDLSTAEGIHQALISSSSALSFFTSKKSYSSPRELEIHKLIEQGAVLSDAEFWNSLKEIL